MGDTFDYCQYQNSWDHGHITGPTTNYFRKVITNVYYSVDSSIKYIERTNTYPLQGTKDTLTLALLEDCELCLDTANFPSNPCNLTFLPNSSYDNRIMNVIVTYLPPEQDHKAFVLGLGEVMNTSHGSYLAGSVGWIDTTQLIYYSGSSTKWGSPYYTFPTGVGNLSNSETIIYPTPNDGKFRLATGVDNPPVEFWVYDILGKVVLRQQITAVNTPINLQQYDFGVYIWKLTEQNKVVSSGKIVVQ